MRVLLIGALAATLVGCNCLLPPQASIEACTVANGFACFDRTAASQPMEPEPVSIKTNSATIEVKSTIAVAAATCSCIVRVLELATAPPVGCEAAMFARVVSESAAALLAGCSRVFNERGGSGMRDAGGSTFAGIMVDLVVFMAGWALSRA